MRDGSTHDPSPELFPDILRRRLIIRIRNHLIQARHKVHILDFNEPALHHKSRADEQDGSEHQRNVIRDEVRRVPIIPKEDGESAEEEDHGDRDDAVPCRVGLEGGFEREEVSVETLSVPAGSEPEVSLYIEGRGGEAVSVMRSDFESEWEKNGYARHRSRAMSLNRR